MEPERRCCGSAPHLGLLFVTWQQELARIKVVLVGQNLSQHLGTRSGKAVDMVWRNLKLSYFVNLSYEKGDEWAKEKGGRWELEKEEGAAVGGAGNKQKPVVSMGSSCSRLPPLPKSSVSNPDEISSPRRNLRKIMDGRAEEIRKAAETTWSWSLHLRKITGKEMDRIVPKIMSWLADDHSIKKMKSQMAPKCTLPRAEENRHHLHSKLNNEVSARHQLEEKSWKMIFFFYCLQPKL